MKFWLFLLTFWVAEAFAAHMTDPLSLGLSAGMMSVAWSQQDFVFFNVPSATIDNVVDANGAVNTAVGARGSSVTGLFSISLGYTKSELGLGVNLEAQYGYVEMPGSSINAQSIAAFVNIDWHSLFYRGHKEESDWGGYASFGAGIFSYVDLSGNYTISGIHKSTTGSINGFPYTSYIKFYEYYDSTPAIKAKLGFERLVSKDAIVAINCFGVFIFSVNDFVSGFTRENALVDAQANDPLFLQGVSIAAPQLFVAGLEVKVYLI